MYIIIKSSCEYIYINILIILAILGIGILLIAVIYKYCWQSHVIIFANESTTKIRQVTCRIKGQKYAIADLCRSNFETLVLHYWDMDDKIDLSWYSCLKSNTYEATLTIPKELRVFIRKCIVQLSPDHELVRGLYVITEETNFQQGFDKVKARLKR